MRVVVEVFTIRCSFIFLESLFDTASFYSAISFDCENESASYSLIQCNAPVGRLARGRQALLELVAYLITTKSWGIRASLEDTPETTQLRNEEETRQPDNPWAHFSDTDHAGNRDQDWAMAALAGCGQRYVI